MRNGDIDTDKQGRSFNRLGQGRHAVSTEQEPREDLFDNHWIFDALNHLHRPTAVPARFDVDLEHPL